MMRAETTISPETDQKLTELCQATGITRREIIRRAIDSYCDQQYLLNEIVKMGQSLIETQAIQMQQIEQNRTTAVHAIIETQNACVAATTKNYTAIRAVINRLDAIERNLGIKGMSDVTSRKIANAACFFMLMLSTTPALFKFGGLV